jgi:asparagine synthase (glutamine-hydrolysing)
MSHWTASHHWGACALGEDQQSCQLGPNPIKSHCGRFRAVLDGDLSNHLSVRRALRFQQWRSDAAVETLVEGVAQRGAAILTELRGSFSFACWDQQRQRLLIGRDRLGLSPLYLQLQDNGVALSSCRQSLEPQGRLSSEQVSELLSFGHLLNPALLQLDRPGAVSMLPSGLVLWIEADGQLRHLRWWPSWPGPRWSALPLPSGQRAGALIRQELELVVAEQLPAGQAATLLGSGLDSAIVSAIASRERPGAVEALVLQPELPRSRSTPASAALEALAAHLGVRLQPVTIAETELSDWVAATLAATPQPTVDGLEMALLAQAAGAQGHTTLLSSMGGSALFGGHPSHQLVPWLRAAHWWPQPLRQHLLTTLLGPRAERFADLPSWEPGVLALACRRWMTTRQLRALGLPELRWPELPPAPLPAGPAQMAWAELFGYTEPMLVRDGQMASRQAGVELRLPLLDHRVVEMALRLPAGLQRQGQRLLQQAFADLLPAGYRGLPAASCALPMRRWLLGPLRPLCHHQLARLPDATLLPDGAGLPRAWVEEQWHLFETGSLHWTRLWCLVVLAQHTTMRSTR